MSSSPTNGQTFYPTQRQWIGNHLDHFVVTAFDGTQYQVSHKILERQDPEPYYDSMEREAVAIYECLPKPDSSSSPPIIAKLRLQVPSHEQVQSLLKLDKSQTDNLERRNPQAFMERLVKARNEFPVPLWWQVPSNRAITEQNALETLTARNCSAIPELLGLVRTEQAKDLPVGMPGGYLHYVLMHKVPGVSLDQVWRPDLPLDEKKLIRAACKKAWKELWDCGYTMVDTNKANLLWDSKTKKIFIVDTEDFSPLQFNNSDRDSKEIEEDVITMLVIFELLDDTEEPF